MVPLNTAAKSVGTWVRFLEFWHPDAAGFAGLGLNNGAVKENSGWRFGTSKIIATLCSDFEILLPFEVVV